MMLYTFQILSLCVARSDEIPVPIMTLQNAYHSKVLECLTQQNEIKFFASIVMHLAD